MMINKGFQGLYVSGAAVTASAGLPDIGYEIIIINYQNKYGNVRWFL